MGIGRTERYVDLGSDLSGTIESMHLLEDRELEAVAPFRLGEWRVDPEIGRLVHDDGTVRRPERKALDLLLALAERPGRPVSRGDLRRRLWNGDHIAPGALKHIVWQLRRDLGDDARAPRYVETVRGRGYRLVVDLSPDAPPASGRSPTFPGSRRLRLAVALGVAVAVCVSVLVLARRDGPATVGEAQPSRPLTSLPGNEVSPSTSPDGRFVVFAWNGEEDGTDYDLYRIAAAGGAPERLYGGPQDEMEPAVSPDGRQLAFLRGDVDRGGTDLLVADLGSGGERLVARSAGRFLDVVWLGSGGGLAVVDRPAAGSPSRILEIDLDGAARPLTEPSGSLPGDLFPAVSPDGERLAFYRRQRGRSGEILLLERSSGAVRALPLPVGRVAGLTFDAAGEGLITSSDRVPPRGLWWIPLAAGEPRWLGLPGSFVTEPSSGGSGVLTYQDQRCDSNLWSLSLPASGEPGVKTAVEALASTRQDMLGAFSPSGDRVAFLSNRGGVSQIWVADWPEGRLRLVPTRGGPVHSLAWSPDGDRLAFAVRESSGVSVVHTARLDGTDPRRISDPTEHSVTPRWSPDGAALYFAEWRDGGWRVVRQGVDGGRATDLGPGVAGQEEPGSGAVWVLDAGGGLTRRSTTAEGGAREVTLPWVAAADAESWQVVDGGVVFVRWDDEGQRVLSRWTAADDGLERLAVLDRNLPYPPGLSLSPDGSSVLWTRIDAVASDLVIVPSTP